MKRFAVDTGPLVALLNASDTQHAWARETFRKIELPLVTCEAVITESCFLASKLRGRADSVLELLKREVLKLSFDLDAEIDAVDNLMMQYASVPMSLADACLVRMAELNDETTIITLDSDFKVYRRHRRHRRQAISLLMPKK